MKLECIGDGEIVRLWADALLPVQIRHPNPSAIACVTLTGDPRPALTLTVEGALDTATHGPHARNPLVISTVRLAYFPGIRLARQWIAAAWAGYLQHEALELVTIRDTGLAVLDPHQEPYNENPWNRGLRDGLPAELAPATIRRALSVVMDQDWADVLVGLGEARS